MTTNPAALWLLKNRLCDVRELSLDGYQDWLRHRVDSWSRDPIFVQRLAIRELRKSHPDLLAAERVFRRARSQDRASDVYHRLSDLEEELNGVGKALVGLAAAGRAAKLAVFKSRQRQLQADLIELTATSPERRSLVDARARLDGLRHQTGLEKQEQVLRSLLRASGQGSGSRGRAFEQAALTYSKSHLMPRLGAELALTGQTLGAADTEFDILLVRSTPQRALVLAAVEAKRNINDLAHGFCLRQRNLEWLAGQGGLQPTAFYTSGRFDRCYPVGDLIFDLASFRQVELHLVTRPGWISGLGSGALARLAHRVSTDVDFGWSSLYMEQLREWTLRLAEIIETPDVLRRPDLNLALLET